MAAKPASLDRAKARKALGTWLATQSGLVAEVARDEPADIMLPTEEINALENASPRGCGPRPCRC